MKSLAIELGRPPNRNEFEASAKGAKYALGKAFGGNFSTLLQAAGLETYSERRSKITNAVFNKDIESHLEQFKGDEWLPREKPYPTAAIISDIHWPFENEHVLRKFYEYLDEYKPEWVIINGDAWDRYCHSKYPRSHNVFTPREEDRLSRERNVEFWAEAKRRSPESKCIQMMGNHDIRPMKQILQNYPAAEDWIERMLKEQFSFEGVTTIFDPREELFLCEDVVVFHGYRSKLGDHRDFTLYSCITGHTHVGGTVFKRIRKQTLFEGNSGVAGNPLSKGLSYTPQKITQWTPGFLVIDKWGPRFIPV